MSRTVKVRIAVAVDANGDWNAVGWKGSDDDSARGAANGGLEATDEPFLVHWVTAELPVPESSEMPGAVEEQTS